MRVIDIRINELAFNCNRFPVSFSAPLQILRADLLRLVQRQQAAAAVVRQAGQDMRPVLSNAR